MGGLGRYQVWSSSFRCDMKVFSGVRLVLILKCVRVFCQVKLMKLVRFVQFLLVVSLLVLCVCFRQFWRICVEVCRIDLILVVIGGDSLVILKFRLLMKQWYLGFFWWVKCFSSLLQQCSICLCGLKWLLLRVWVQCVRCGVQMCFRVCWVKVFLLLKQ